MSLTTSNMLPFFGIERAIICMNIKFGECHCGCGGKAPIASRNRHHKGIIKGQPMKYIVGHINRLPPIVGNAKVCGRCKEEKPLNQFGPDKRTVSGYRSYCRQCHSVEAYEYRKNIADEKLQEWSDKRAERVRISQKYILDTLRANPCVDCNEPDIVVLEFDHVRGVKEGNIAKLTRSANLDRLKKEIDKCEVVCANCHRRRTARRAGYWKAGIHVNN